MVVARYSQGYEVVRTARTLSKLLQVSQMVVTSKEDSGKLVYMYSGVCICIDI